MKEIVLTVLLIIESNFIVQAQDTNVCGLRTPSPDKTCISLRLPWQEDPIYFCTDKRNVNYIQRCGDRTLNYCGSNLSKKTLQVATPWDCCPLTSIPDPCDASERQRNCPSAPFNRTCTQIAPDGKNAWDCCPKYFCDTVTPEACYTKRLQPECISPPKGKSNCIAFRDIHGCCHKYQCEGEGKPGMCPMEVRALQFKKRMENATSTSGWNKLDKTTLAPLEAMPARFFSFNSLTTSMNCVGDTTCPGKMKCCSLDMATYHGASEYLRPSPVIDMAISGYCMDPETEIETI